MARLPKPMRISKRSLSKESGKIMIDSVPRLTTADR